MKEIRPSVVAKNPKLSTVEVSSIIGKMWKSLDAAKKEKFSKGYEDEKAGFMDVMNKYKENLTPDDIKNIKELKADKKERKTFLLQKKKSRELGKPKKPISSFLRYLKMQTDRKPDEDYPIYLKRVSGKWLGLTENEREKFKPSVQELESYK